MTRVDTVCRRRTTRVDMCGGGVQAQETSLATRGLDCAAAGLLATALAAHLLATG